MSRLISAPFFSATPVFDRAEYAAAVGRRPGDKTVSAMLAHHLRAGNIKRIARGVFASVPKHADSRTYPVDRFQAASRLRRGGVIAYHAAIDLHGCAYTLSYDVHVIAPGRPGIIETEDFSCQFIRPPRGFNLKRDTILLERMGVYIRATTLERTIADLFARPDLAGGGDEIFNCLDLISMVDEAALLRHARSLGNATAAGALGYWLEQAQERLRIQDSTIQKLRKLAPRQHCYALDAGPGYGRTAKGWNVIMPPDTSAPLLEDA